MILFEKQILCNLGMVNGLNSLIISFYEQDRICSESLFLIIVLKNQILKVVTKEFQ